MPKISVWGRILQFSADPQNSLFVVELRTLTLQWGHHTPNCRQRAMAAHSLKRLPGPAPGRCCQPCFSPGLLPGNEPLVYSEQRVWKGTPGSPASRGSKLSSSTFPAFASSLITVEDQLQSDSRQTTRYQIQDLWKQEETLFCFKEYTCEKYSCVSGAGPFSWAQFGKAWLFWLSWGVLILDPNGSV